MSQIGANHQSSFAKSSGANRSSGRDGSFAHAAFAEVENNAHKSPYFVSDIFKPHPKKKISEVVT
jgi:hypothetical protein